MAACDPFTEEELGMVLANFAGKCAVRDRAIFAFGCASGFRISEVLSLKRGDIINEKGNLRKFVTIAKTKNGDPRRVIVNSLAQSFVQDWLKEQQEVQKISRADSFVFTTSTGNAVSRQHFWKAMKTAFRGVDFSREHYATHSMRKTYAWELYCYYHDLMMKGERVEPLLKVQEALGHKTLDATKDYLGPMLGNTDDRVRALYSNVSAKFADIKNRIKLNEKKTKRRKPVVTGVRRVKK
jgi:integrase